MQRKPSFDEYKAKQESLPVGCVPSAAVAVGGGGFAQGDVCPEGFCLWGVCQEGLSGGWEVSARECLPGGVYPSMH